MRKPLFPRSSGRSIRYQVFTKIILAILLGPGSLAADPLIHDDYQYELDGDEVSIVRYLGSDEQVAIPSQILGMPVTRIKRLAFSYSYLPKTVTVEIPNSVMTIENYAFNTNSITSIFIGSGVTSVGDRPFEGNSPLKEITVSENNLVFSSQDGVLLSKDGTTLIRFPMARSGTFTVPTNINRIGPGAFFRAGNLVEILLPDNLTEIGDSAFMNCGSLSSITIPESVVSIGDSAFSGCSSLSSITIPESVISIGDFAFFDCRRLPSITIPESVVSIGNGILAMGPQRATEVGWVTIQVADGNPAYSSVDGVLFDKEMTTLVQFPPGLYPPFSEYAIAEGITEIRPSAFQGNALRVDITLPDSLTHIGSNAFSYSRMRSVVLSEKVVSIGDRAFYECCLTSIVIPDSVESIGKFAFYRNFFLDEVTFGSGLRSIDDYAFSRTLLGSERYTYSGGLVRYMPGHLTLPSGLIHIGTGAFFRNDWLAEVTLPESLETIGEGPFRGCGSLWEVHIAENNPNFTVESGVLFDKSGETLFFFSHGLRGDYHIPPTVTTIAAGAFHGHTASRIVVPSSVRHIGARAFAFSDELGVSHASIFFLGDAPTTVGHEAFASGRNTRFWYIMGKTGWEDILPNDNMHILPHPVLLLDTQGGPNGWHTLDGFGMFFPNLFSDWLFHADHGWIFYQAVSFEEFRIYFPRWELWASMSSPLLPWFYAHSPVDSWVFLEFGEDGPTLVLL